MSRIASCTNSSDSGRRAGPAHQPHPLRRETGGGARLVCSPRMAAERVVATQIVRYYGHFGDHDQPFDEFTLVEPLIAD